MFIREIRGKLFRSGLTVEQLGVTRKLGEKPSGAKARQFIAEYRRHECLLHPVMIRIQTENALSKFTWTIHADVFAV
jgi:hypothetical protein